jgi:release factor glutamine methyltransferase
MGPYERERHVLEPDSYWQKSSVLATSHTGPVAVTRLSTPAVVDRLRAAGCVAAEEEAEQLMKAAPDAATLEAWLERREHGEPLAWVVGAAEFCGRTVKIDRGVYVPRSQSEELARRAVAMMPATGGWAADLCTGSGAVAVHLQAEAPTARVVGVDNDRRAVVCARANGVTALLGDLNGPLRPGIFDVVTAVAPYVPAGELHYLPADVQRYEPAAALDGGPDGLRVVRRVVEAAGSLLRPGGWLLTEVGGNQDEALATTLRARGFDAVSTWCDEDGDLRGLAAPRSSSTRRGARA